MNWYQLYQAKSNSLTRHQMGQIYEVCRILLQASTKTSLVVIVQCTLYIAHCTLYIVQSSRWELYNVHRTSYSLAGGNCKVHIVHRTAQPINFVFIVAASLLRLDCAICVLVVASAPRRECCPQVARLVPPGGRQIGRITAGTSAHANSVGI